MTNDYELLDIKIKGMRHDIEGLQKSVYGDKSVVNGGGVGLVGKMEKANQRYFELEDVVKANHIEARGWYEDGRISDDRQKERLERLEQGFAELDRYARRWWRDFVLAAGGVGIVLLLLIEVLKMAGVL